MNTINRDSSVDIFGVQFTSSQENEVLDFLLKTLHSEGPREVVIVFTPTTEQVVMAQHDQEFRQVLEQSTINLPDSVGVIYADLWQSWKRGERHRLMKRITGIDMAWTLALKALETQHSVYLLGGKEGVAEQAAKTLAGALNKPHDNLLTRLGWDAGSQNIAHEKVNEREKVLKRILAKRPELLLVAFGAPWQEKWLVENRVALTKAGVKVAMVVGGAFDVWAGNMPRAPFLMRKIGLEWWWRLMLEPKRWKRQLRLLEFVKMVVSK